MKFIQTLQKWGWHNDPTKWAEDSVVRQPDFNLKKFQEKIDSIVGVTPNKKSIVRISWAWSEQCFSRFYTDWNAAGQPIKDTLRAKYIYRSIEIDSETVVDICPPRFVLEELIHPSQYHDAWERNRYQFDQRLKIRVPLRPMPPRDGYYAFLDWIGSHDKNGKCCQRAAKQSTECYGLFRLPNQKDLNLLSKQVKMIQFLKHRPNPYKPISTEDLELIQADTESLERDKYEQKMAEKEESRLELSEILRPLAAYSLPGEIKTTGGLILPK